MINSRKIEDLHPFVQGLAKKFISECKKQGIEILVTSTYRDKECQTALYAQGRTKPGKIVTDAKAGRSWHNWCVAFDVVPLVHGKPDWDNNALWHKIGGIGKNVGLEWAGDWHSFQEFPHFQYTGGLTLADFQSGKVLSTKLV